jgi:hypothetical protein
MRQFRSLAAFRKYAKRAGLRVKKVTTTKALVRYIALDVGGICGFFHERPGTGKGTGHLDIQGDL